MSLLDKFKHVFEQEDGSLIDVIKNSADKNNIIAKMAIAHAIDLIASTVARTKLEVFEYDTEKKKIENKRNDIYYRLNVKANKNQTASQLKYDLAVQLLIKQKALIIMRKNDKKEVPYLYLADDFSQTKEITTNRIFTNVKLKDIDGNTEMLKGKYTTENSIYLTYKNKKIKSAIDDYKSKTSTLMTAAEKSYKQSNIPKWRLKVPGNQPAMKDPATNKDITYEDYKKKITQGLFEDSESVLLLSELFELVNLNKDNNKSANDYLDMVKEIGSKVAMLFDIPLDVFFGNKTDKSKGNSDFITYAVLPIFTTIEEGLNFALIDEDDYIKGEEVRFKKYVMQHTDITDLAYSLDKMTAMGFSFNQICDFLGLPQIDEPWANEHRITKNYGTIAKGGEK